MSTLSLPSSIQTSRKKWSYMVTASIAFASLQEVQRLLISQAVRLWRRRSRRSKDGSLESLELRGVAVQADSEQECLICSGFRDDASLSSSPDVEPNLLQGLCTAAPDKHLLHLACFLRWQREYILQRGHVDPIHIEDSEAETDADEATIVGRGKALLAGAGLSYLARALCLGEDNSWEQLLSPFGPSLPRSPTLAIHAQPSSDSCLATLRTSSPPCPGCRSPVQLHFYRKALSHAAALSILSKISSGFKDIRRDALSLITGRTLVSKILTQLSFLFAVLAMLKRRSLPRP